MAASVRYKIHKKSVDKKKKDKKLQKKNPSFTRPKKDPGIPSMYPFKEKLLNQIELVKKQKQDEKINQKLANKKKQLEDAFSNKRSISELAESAAVRGEDYEMEVSNRAEEDEYSQGMEVEGVATGDKDNSRRAYYREFIKVVQSSDVILEVLDARDPLGTRSKQIEQLISEKYGKKLVLLLNKTDLVPRDNLIQWLGYLRKEKPTILFKANTQQQRTNLGINSSGGSALGSSTECFGGESLLQLLKNYSRNSNIKTAITVGVIGFPNVGKSSIINSLKRARVCAVGPTPGFTKSIQLVNLDKTIKLLDSPGVVFNFGSGGKNKKSEAELNEICLRNVIKVELLNNPIGPASVVIKRCNSDNLAAKYDILPFASPTEFLVQLAKKSGRFKRGGIPDLDSAARIILNDWNTGKIPYYTTVPGQKQEAIAAAKNKENTTIVTGWSKEFDISSLENMDSQVLDSADAVAPQSQKRSGMVAVSEGRELDLDNYTLEDSNANENDSVSDLEMSVEEEDEDEDEDEDEVEKVVVNIKAPTVPLTRKSVEPTEVSAEGLLNAQANRDRKRIAKKAAKKRARVAEPLAVVEDGDISVDEDPEAPYDFNSYFKQQPEQAQSDDSSDEDL
ncbi:Guanine nucleotide-binding protein-like 3-like protein [Smittium mucronatum]|uniref:Guanine nucleotide-binding protein-like 3-like protein n=1 Tax=Smittium mucronatum TaxID=133383 RepID=A0A1R0GR21_9FUNG|nr:Guanine nucleotide-binding protein-like 3-like protein [Smittium mucronatum]